VPDQILRAVQQEEAAFGFGARLRACVEPDFITRAIVGDGSGSAARISRGEIETSSAWLVPAICADMQKILTRVPGGAATHLLLMISEKVFYFTWRSSFF
jgi:hypothetical protein